jgi:diguanylate cyclase (GGDEF)-like protein/PAS domain S-box-containing protein
MADGTTLDAAARDAVFASMLEQYPDAHVFAIGDNGLFVDMPVDLRDALSGQKVVRDPASGLDLVVPEDHIVVIDTWIEALRAGGANALVRPIADPTQSIRLHYLDMRHRYGVMVGMMTGFLAGGGTREIDHVSLVPRLSVVKKNQVAVLVEVDAAAALMLDTPAGDLVGHRTLEFIHPDDHQRAISSWMEMLARPGSAGRVRLRHRRGTGDWLWLEITNHNLLNDPDHGYVLAEMVDISEEMAMHEALRASEQLLRRLTEALPLGVLQLDHDRRIVYQNTYVADALGLEIGATLSRERFGPILPEYQNKLDTALTAALREARDSDFECGYQHSDAGIGRCNVSLRALTAPSGEVTGAVLCVTDVTQDVRLREELTYRASHDALTRCRNRESTLTALEESLATDVAGTAVIFIDLDEFKQVNDRLGHAAGDELLQHVADRLRSAARTGDLVGRLGGDEFAIVCRGVPSLDEAHTIAARIADSVRRGQISYGGEQVRPSASVGVAWAGPGGRLAADALLASADGAMYEAKKRRTDGGAGRRAA